ncbi:cellulose binding domain-containing protein [Actinoplanes friuliensis]|uniref:Activator of hsp90 ATPase 1 family protein n=1 Tax=Actinoplanes friuliensis DSM 7358 TaxID=1246995 RepID=U5VYJ1_9ACTN|nr:cellulose binding domain-containing protein [Actinoplanes friuliensis]AGZ40785.1 activator of hsp90 ATPase 1 family protein [Actinoplanes friuliensis DSM 7358]
MSRRTFSVVVLDSLLSLATKLQSGPMPEPRVRTAGATRGRLWRILMVAGVLAALGGAALVVTVLIRTPEGSAGRPETAAGLPGPPIPPAGTDAVEPSAVPTTRPVPTLTLPSSVATSASSRPPTTSPSAGRGSSTPESAVVPLTARYTTSSVTAGLLGYHLDVTITNPAPRAHTDWRLVVTLPRSTLSVSGVSGATATQDGAAWTFTPDDTTSRVAPRASVTVSFNVNGATLLNAAPTDCQIDNTPCTT